MDHPFYARSPSEQRAFRIRFIAGCVGLAVVIVGAALLLPAPWGLLLAPLLLALLLQVAAPFLDTPSGRARGSLVYYAPLFLVEPLREGVMVLHGGTLFDYWFVLRGPMSAHERRQRVVRDFLRGLIAVAEEHVREGGPSFRLRATTYILHPATARRAGFERAPTSAGAVLVWLNALLLTVAYSLVQRRLRLPPLHRTRTYEASIESLVHRLPRLRALETRLARRSTKPEPRADRCPEGPAA